MNFNHLDTYLKDVLAFKDYNKEKNDPEIEEYLDATLELIPDTIKEIVNFSEICSSRDWVGF